MSLRVPRRIAPTGGATAAQLDSGLADLFANQADLEAQGEVLAAQLTELEARLTLSTTALATLAGPTAVQPEGILMLDAHDLSGIAVPEGMQSLAPYGYLVSEWDQTSPPANAFTLQDSAGQLFIPDGTTIQVSTDDVTYLPVTPTWEDQQNMLKAFDGQLATAFSAGELEELYIKATLPTETMLDPRITAIAIHPEPPLAYQLLGATYQYDSTEADLSDGTEPDGAIGWTALSGDGIAALPALFILQAPRNVQWVKFHYKVTAPVEGWDYAFWVSHLGAYYLTWPVSYDLLLDLAPALPEGATIDTAYINYGANDQVELTPSGTTVAATLSYAEHYELYPDYWPLLIRNIRVTYTEAP